MRARPCALTHLHTARIFGGQLASLLQDDMETERTSWLHRSWLLLLLLQGCGNGQSRH